METTDKLLVACASCGTANRVPRERLGDDPKCGRSQPVAARFGIRSIPTLIVFRDGRESARISGAMDARSLAGWLGRELGA